MESFSKNFIFATMVLTWFPLLNEDRPSIRSS